MLCCKSYVATDALVPETTEDMFMKGLFILIFSYNNK